MSSATEQVSDAVQAVALAVEQLSGSVREIAERLQVPEGTVKTWMFRGRRTLRRHLQKEEGP